MSNKSPKKLLLPHLQLTTIANASDEEATVVRIPNSTLIYHTKLSAEVNNSFNLFPIVLNLNGTPWAEAVIYIISKLKGTNSPVMGTYASIAEDLSIFKRFIDEAGLDWTCFPSQKLSRPTYRFNGHLKLLVGSGEMAVSTAKRTMGTIIAFYRWIQEEKLLKITYPAWKETDRYIEFTDSRGFSNLKKVVSTDLKIDISVQKDPYTENIEDGGKLRPLPFSEQEWLIDALDKLGNTEQKLIHLFSMLTGARIQTVLTLKVKHVNIDLENYNANEIRLPVGPGTGIDTKHDKKMVLHIPIWFYTQLQIYANSEQAKKRRNKAIGGDNENQYLFLTVRSVPYYEDKASKRAYNPSNVLRHSKVGQGVRQFISEKIIPFIRTKYNVPKFHYRFHDMRATAGMNWTDYGLSLVERNELTLKDVREFVKIRMGHESAAVTDRYLQYRQHQQLTKDVSIGYEDWIQMLSTKNIGDINE